MKKIFKMFFVLFVFFSLTACSCKKNNDEDYAKSESKTFNNANFTITAAVDYVQSNEYGEEVLVLEGLNGESIVAYYDYGNQTINTDNTSL